MPRTPFIPKGLLLGKIVNTATRKRIPVDLVEESPKSAWRRISGIQHPPSYLSKILRDVRDAINLQVPFGKKLGRVKSIGVEEMPHRSQATRLSTLLLSVLAKGEELSKGFTCVEQLPYALHAKQNLFNQCSR
ncbi:hypothetical protein TWF694_003660 [Orbilia ellipsospora]|uniref:Uncharacterized protein n=1 Tax=Orbilia ellipsospora TaxID=2528407 RepID=A0AAV9X008_9PEZI